MNDSAFTFFTLLWRRWVDRGVAARAARKEINQAATRPNHQRLKKNGGSQ